MTYNYVISFQYEHKFIHKEEEQITRYKSKDQIKELHQIKQSPSILLNPVKRGYHEKDHVV